MGRSVPEVESIGPMGETGRPYGPVRRKFGSVRYPARMLMVAGRPTDEQGERRGNESDTGVQEASRRTHADCEGRGRRAEHGRRSICHNAQRRRAESRRPRPPDRRRQPAPPVGAPCTHLPRSGDGRRGCGRAAVQVNPLPRGCSGGGRRASCDAVIRFAFERGAPHSAATCGPLLVLPAGRRRTGTGHAAEAMAGEVPRGWW